MNIVVLGLTVSSSWGNGHATLWRALGRALSVRGHRLVFFERDVPYYAAHRDGTEFPGIDLRLYREWADLRGPLSAHLASADVVMLTSFCPDGGALARVICEAPRPLRVFYDLDTPVTLAKLDAGEAVDYLPADGLGAFDLVLSYTGGRALDALRTRLGARRTAPLYGSVDPQVHHPAQPQASFAGDLSYLGTFAADRQPALESLLVEPARRAPHRRFVIGGAQYPADFPWTPNMFFVQHLPAADHPAFFASSPLTLNVTRAAMAAMGTCPSGRLFEAAACGTAIISDAWEGLDQFFCPGDELLVARDADDVVQALDLPRDTLTRIARRARERTLAEHTATVRARELEALLESASRRADPAEGVACSA
ncbi:MAG TPA: glycosyltransferase [Polyangia bacterium]|nr:glycosyltransferase [Polyangia bacterium]